MTRKFIGVLIIIGLTVFFNLFLSGDNEELITTSSQIKLNILDEYYGYNYESEATIVTLQFEVRGMNNEYIGGLSTKNFSFYEDGEKADIESYSDAVGEKSKIPLTMILDVSYSMEAAGAITEMERAARRFERNLKNDANFRYYKFATKVEKISSLYGEIRTDPKYRFTSIYDAVSKAIKEDETKKRVIILFTDGKDNHSLERINSLMSDIDKNRIKIHCIGLGNVDKGSLLKLSKNGSFYHSDSIKEISTLFDKVLKNVRSIYTVNYYSPSRRGNHTLKLVVTYKGSEASYETKFISGKSGSLTDNSTGNSSSPRVTLRSSYRTLSGSDIKSMFKRIGFFDRYWNINGNFSNDFSVKTIRGDKVVVDKTTGLMWHQGGSSSAIIFSKAKEWISSLNNRGYAGYYDWRLPTLEEGASLLKSSKRNGVYIDPVFSSKQLWIWTGDSYSSTSGWVVYFGNGNVNRYNFNAFNYVRPVRSVHVKKWRWRYKKKIK